jgi:hypothetical protein
MATLEEYARVATVLLAQINSDIATKVPGWQQHMIPQEFRAPLAGELAKIAVDTIDQLRAPK